MGSYGSTKIKQAIILTPDDEDLIYLYADILFKKKQYYNVISQLKRVTDSQRKFLILSDVYLISGNTKYSYNYLNKANKYNETKEEKKYERKGVRGIWTRDSKKFIYERTDSRHIKDLWVINSVSKKRPTLETKGGSSLTIS